MDIENTNAFEKINKVNTKELWTIYEFIEEAYFKEFDIFPNDFIKICKDNVNEARFVPLEVKNNIKLMSMEQGLYAQLDKLSRKDLKFISANKIKNEAKFKFQGQSARSQRCFDLDFDWIELNFSTRETALYLKKFKATTIHQIQIRLKVFKFQ